MIRHRNQAFSLVEVTIAIGVAAFCLLVIFAMLPAGLTSNQTSVHQTIAAGLAAGIAADLRSAPRNGDSLRYGLKPDTTGEATIYLSEDGAKLAGPEDFSARFAAVVDITASTGIGDTAKVLIKMQTPPGAAEDSRTTIFEAWTAIDRAP